MKAIILCAGYATRLYPLTKHTPKPLLQVKGKAIIDYIVDEICTIDDVTDIYVISNGLFYDQFLEWSIYANCSKSVHILNDFTTSNEGRLGAIGDINLCIDSFAIDDDLLIIAGDNLFDFSLLDAYNKFKQKNKDLLCVKRLESKEQLRNFAVATVNSNNVITNIIEKPEQPESNIACFATYFYKKDTVSLFKKYLDEGNNKDAPGYFVEYLHKIKEVYAYEFDGNCYDIGTLEAYNEIKDTF